MKELDVARDYNEGLLTTTTKKLQEELNAERIRVQQMESERGAFELQLNEIHNELTNSHLLNKVREIKRSKKKTKKSLSSFHSFPHSQKIAPVS